MEKATDSFEYAQEQATALEARWRRIIACGFKLIAVLGGVMVASGVDPKLAQRIGIALAVVIAVDAVFSNHERLVGGRRRPQCI